MLCCVVLCCVVLCGVVLCCVIVFVCTCACHLRACIVDADFDHSASMNLAETAEHISGYDKIEVSRISFEVEKF